jgi:hypothetical protein
MGAHTYSLTYLLAYLLSLLTIQHMLSISCHQRVSDAGPLQNITNVSTQLDVPPYVWGSIVAKDMYYSIAILLI